MVGCGEPEMLPQLAAQRTESFAGVQAALQEGFLQSYLRLNGYIAREDDIHDAIAFYDAQGTQARRRGRGKRRTDGEFIYSWSRLYGAVTATIRFVGYDSIERLKWALSS